MHYALVAYDRPNAVAARMAVRPDHLKHLESLGRQLILAGPFLNAAGEMVGSFMVVEAQSQDEAETVFRRDPYWVADLFETCTITPWRLVVNNTR